MKVCYGCGVPGRLARFDRTGQMNRAPVQQQFFSQRRLTGVRMGNNCKGAAALDLCFELRIRHIVLQSICQAVQPPSLKDLAADGLWNRDLRF